MPAPPDVTTATASTHFEATALHPEPTAQLSTEAGRLVKVFKALSDQTRQQILQLLEERQRNVGEIVGEFQLSQPTISRHLSVLKEADLVVDRRHGQNVIYSLNDRALSSSMQQFFGRFSSCQQALR